MSALARRRSETKRKTSLCVDRIGRRARGEQRERDRVVVLFDGDLQRRLPTGQGRIVVGAVREQRRDDFLRVPGRRRD